MSTIKPSNYNTLQRAARLVREIDEGAQRAKAHVSGALGEGNVSNRRGLTMALKSIRQGVKQLEKLRDAQRRGDRG